MWKALIKLVEKWGCSHKWNDLHKTIEYDSPENKIPVAIHRTLACENCGKIKKIKV